MTPSNSPSRGYCLFPIFFLALLHRLCPAAGEALLDASNATSYFTFTTTTPTDVTAMSPSDEELACTRNATQQFLLRLQQYQQGGDIHAQPGLVNSILGDVLDAALVPCLRAAFAADQDDIQGFLILVQDRTACGYQLMNTFRPLAQWLQANRQMQVQAMQVEEEALVPLSSYGDEQPPAHGYVLVGSVPLLQNSLIINETLDMTAITHTPLASWQDDVFPAVANNVGMFDGSRFALPIDGNILMAFYRKEAVGLLAGELPSTWEQLLEAARSLNGTVDYDGDGIMDYALCVTRTLGCTPLLWTSYMAASFLSTGSPEGQGAFFDPADGSPLIDNPAMRFALDYWRQLQAFVRPDTASHLANTTCATRPTAFITGKCGIMLGISVQFQDIQSFKNSTAKGRTISARIPGSTMVLNRALNVLETCTASSCPQAETMQDPISNSVLLVNRPTILFADNMAVSMSSHTPLLNLENAKFATSIIASAEASLQYAFRAGNGLSPYRSSQLNLTIWVGVRGTDPDDTISYFKATKDSMRAPNAVTDLWLPGLDKAMRADIDFFTNAHRNRYIDTDRAVQLLVSNLDYHIDAWGRQNMLYLYRGMIKWQPPPPPMPPPVSNDDVPPFIPTSPHSSNALFETLTQIVAPVVAALLVILIGVLGWAIRAFLHQGRVAKGTPPPAGEDTTLLVTDIQGSTTLWEAMPASVMDAAVKEHHTLLRKLLQQHSGYESATEGDSFLLAFHTAQDAVQFAMDAQKGLLTAAWPQELLEHELCADVFAAAGELDPVQRGVASHHLDRYAPGRLPWDVDNAGVPGRGASGELASFQTSNGTDQTAGSNITTWLEKVESALLATFPSLNSLRMGAEISTDARAEEHPVCRRRSFARTATCRAQQQVDCPETPVTFSQACKLAYKAVSKAPTDAPVSLIFRGLRVRMGLSSGVEIDGVAKGGSGGRTQYSGPSMDFTKALADCGCGGMVLLSQSSYQRLPMQQLWQDLVLLHCGTHCVKEGHEPIDVYQALGRSWRSRVGHFDAITTKSQHALGVLDAPLGNVAILFLYPIGITALLAWNADVARQAVKLLHEAAAQELRSWRGCAVEAAETLMLLVFKESSDAIMFSLELQQRLLLIDWPAELLGHELCEQVVVDMPQPDGRVEHRLVMRGLRTKIGIDFGGVLGSVHPMTGCIQYRGKVMNRAARIASAATSGQVLCSSEVWGSTADSELLTMRGVDADSVGRFKLKGLPELLELFSCRYNVASQTALPAMQCVGTMVESGSRGSQQQLSGLLCDVEGANVTEQPNQPKLLSQTSGTITEGPMPEPGGAAANLNLPSLSDNAHVQNVDQAVSVAMERPFVRQLSMLHRNVAFAEEEGSHLAPLSAEEMMQCGGNSGGACGGPKAKSWWPRAVEQLRKKQDLTAPEPPASEWEALAQERDVVEAVDHTSSSQGRSTRSHGRSTRSSMGFYPEHEAEWSLRATVDRATSVATDQPFVRQASLLPQKAAFAEEEGPHLAPLSAEEMMQCGGIGGGACDVPKAKNWWPRAGVQLRKKPHSTTPEASTSEWEALAQERDVVEAVDHTSSSQGRSTRSRGPSTRSSMAFYPEHEAEWSLRLTGLLKHSTAQPCAYSRSTAELIAGLEGPVAAVPNTLDITSNPHGGCMPGGPALPPTNSPASLQPAGIPVLDADLHHTKAGPAARCAGSDMLPMAGPKVAARHGTSDHATSAGLAVDGATPAIPDGPRTALSMSCVSTNLTRVLSAIMESTQSEDSLRLAALSQPSLESVEPAPAAENPSQQLLVSVRVEGTGCDAKKGAALGERYKLYIVEDAEGGRVSPAPANNADDDDAVRSGAECGLPLPRMLVGRDDERDA